MHFYFFLKFLLLSFGIISIFWLFGFDSDVKSGFVKKSFRLVWRSELIFLSAWVISAGTEGNIGWNWFTTHLYLVQTGDLYL